MRVPLRIIHIGPSNLPLRHGRGGAIERRMLELAAAQARRGHDVAVYSAETKDSSFLVDGFELRTISCRRTGGIRRFEFMNKAIRHAWSSPCDVLHFHSMPEGAAFSSDIDATKLLSYDYFIFRKGKKTPFYWCYRHALSKFDCLLPVSEFCRTESLRYWHLEDAPVAVLHNGVNLDQFRPSEEQRASMRSKLGLRNEPVVLYIGRVCFQKGTDILVDAYAHLRTAIPNARLLVAGPADLFGKDGGNLLTKRIQDVGGIYLGAVEENELAAVYNSGDVFVMASRSDEMFGMSAVEAQACGKPVICSEHGGLPEVVSRESGLFFPVGDSRTLAQRLSEVLLSDGLYDRMSRAATENARRFSWDRLAREADGLYAQRVRDNRKALTTPDSFANTLPQ
jgi:glycosyltransferase involved in cell wall biosynthesis